MTVASFIASQRTDHGVPHAVSCRALEVAPSTFYKWHQRPPTARQQRRVALDAAVKASFEASGGVPRTYGSPRVHADLVADGWTVSPNTVAASMARQGLQGRSPKRKRRSLTRPDKAAEPVPDLVGRDFDADGVDEKWCGDLTEIPTGEGKLYLATVEDLGSRRLPGFAMGEHHDAELAKAALCMAAATRGGDIAGVIFHSDKGSEYTAGLYAQACAALGVVQSMGRVGSALDNAAAESFNSTLEHEVLSRPGFETKDQARRAVARFIDAYNHTRRHSSCEMLPPVVYEQILAQRAAQASDTQKRVDLRPIYQAPTDDAAEDALGAFAAKWDGRCPMIAEQWRNAWDRFTPFLAFPAEVRRIIYTTDSIESLNFQLRKIIKSRGHFPSDDAAGPEERSRSDQPTVAAIASHRNGQAVPVLPGTPGGSWCSTRCRPDPSAPPTARPPAPTTAPPAESPSLASEADRGPARSPRPWR